MGIEFVDGTISTSNGSASGMVGRLHGAVSYRSAELVCVEVWSVVGIGTKVGAVSGNVDTSGKSGVAPVNRRFDDGNTCDGCDNNVAFAFRSCGEDSTICGSAVDGGVILFHKGFSRTISVWSAGILISSFLQKEKKYSKMSSVRDVLQCLRTHLIAV